jgi:8-oxo-dGTP diphosphatase
MVAGGGTDYPFRATAGRKAVATAVARIAEDITYSNFKNEVARELGHERAHVYGSVWGVMRDLEDLKERATGPRRRAAPSSGGAPRAKARAKPTRELRYGGVVVNEEGKVLLFEPHDHFGGYVWTFPKGTQDEGESPEQTALREVEEETGVRARIVGEVPGEFPGTTSTTRYFLMRAEGQPGKPGAEAQAVRWASFDEAPSLILETTTSTGRKRDLAVLEAARKTL